MPTDLIRRALRLSWLTIIYNVIEGLVSIWFGLAAGSAALIGFGLDSFVESLSGGVMVWRFTPREMSAEQEERAERRAVRLVGWTFLILGMYVLFESLEKLLSREAPHPSLGGIIVAIASLIVMPWLARAKRRTGEELDSAALIGDFQGDSRLRLAIGGPAAGARPQQVLRAVVGRSGRRPGDRLLPAARGAGDGLGG